MAAKSSRFFINTVVFTTFFMDIFVNCTMAKVYFYYAAMNAGENIRGVLVYEHD